MPQPPTRPGDRRQRAQALAAAIYPTHRRRLLAIATRNSPTTEDAEEALQDAFALFIDHFDPNSAAPPIAWLTLTLKRRCWSYYRHHSHFADTAPDPTDNETENSTDHSPHDLADTHAQTEELRSHLRQLKPQERRALSLLALGYTYREITDITGWTYTKVNRCLTEGRSALRRLATDTNPQPHP